jgi:hypothetical protein
MARNRSARTSPDRPAALRQANRGQQSRRRSNPVAAEGSQRAAVAHRQQSHVYSHENCRHGDGELAMFGPYWPLPESAQFQGKTQTGISDDSEYTSEPSNPGSHRASREVLSSTTARCALWRGPKAVHFQAAQSNSVFTATLQLEMFRLDYFGCKPSANFLRFPYCQSVGDSPSIHCESRPAGLVMAGHRYLNQCRMNGSSTRTRIRCATLRHAEMPKGSRRAPNVYRRVHSRPRHTAGWVGLIDCSSRINSSGCHSEAARRSREEPALIRTRHPLLHPC